MTLRISAVVKISLLALLCVCVWNLSACVLQILTVDDLVWFDRSRVLRLCWVASSAGAIERYYKSLCFCVRSDATLRSSGGRGRRGFGSLRWRVRKTFSDRSDMENGAARSSRRFRGGGIGKQLLRVQYAIALWSSNFIMGKSCLWDLIGNVSM